MLATIVLLGICDFYLAITITAYASAADIDCDR